MEILSSSFTVEQFSGVNADGHPDLGLSQGMAQQSVLIWNSSCQKIVSHSLCFNAIEYHSAKACRLRYIVIARIVATCFARKIPPKKEDYNI